MPAALDKIHYFLIRFKQTKITYLFSSTTGWVKENESFLLIEPCSRVIRCQETKLQFSFRKYISICTVYNVLIRLISAFLYDLHWTHGGSNSWEKPTVSGTKMEQWPVNLLPIGKPRAVDNMTSLFWGCHIECSACTCRAINRKWCNKNIQCDNP